MRAAVLFGLILGGYLLTGCEGCDDCGPLQREPSVNVKFINQDSLESVQDSIVSLNLAIDDIDATLATLSVEKALYDDSLAVVDQEIADGATDLDDLRAELQGKSDSLEMIIVDEQDLRASEIIKRDQLTATRTDIENGLLRLDSLISKTNNTVFDFGVDSLSLFPFPLSVNRDSTLYEIYIDGEAYDLSLEYIRNFNEDEKSRIEVIASNVIIINHSFREAINSCENCASYETSITVYF